MSNLPVTPSDISASGDTQNPVTEQPGVNTETLAETTKEATTGSDNKVVTVTEELEEYHEDEFDPEAYESLKGLISTKAAQADELSTEIKELNESLKNILINDRELSTAEEEAKVAKKNAVKRKKDLMGTAEAQSIKAKLIEVKDELHDIEDSLSTQLLNLYQMTGVQEFEEPDTGEVREFVIKARVKSKKK